MTRLDRPLTRIASSSPSSPAVEPVSLAELSRSEGSLPIQGSNVPEQTTTRLFTSTLHHRVKGQGDCRSRALSNRTNLLTILLLSSSKLLFSETKQSKTTQHSRNSNVFSTKPNRPKVTYNAPKADQSIEDGVAHRIGAITTKSLKIHTLTAVHRVCTWWTDERDSYIGTFSQPSFTAPQYVV